MVPLPSQLLLKNVLFCFLLSLLFQVKYLDSKMMGLYNDQPNNLCEGNVRYSEIKASPPPELNRWSVIAFQSGFLTYKFK